MIGGIVGLIKTYVRKKISILEKKDRLYRIVSDNLEAINNNVDKRNELYFNTIKAQENGSSKYSTWSFSLFGGSILMLLHGRYVHPESLYYRLPYLLVLGAWVFLALSLYYGTRSTGNIIAAELYKENYSELIDVFDKANYHFSKQIYYFKYSLIFFGLWVIYYLIYWIFLLDKTSKPYLL